MDVFPPLRGPINNILGRSAILGSSKLLLVEPLLPPDELVLLPTSEPTDEPSPVATSRGGCWY
jgi:hypothetical protein